MFTQLRVQGYRSIDDSGNIPLGPITVVVGRNNSGKSALVRAPYLMQDVSIWQQGDIRIGRSEMTMELAFDELPDQLKANFRNWTGPGVMTLSYKGPNRVIVIRKLDAPEDQPVTGALNLSNRDPFNLFFPVLSGRRPAYYREQISNTNSFTVSAQDNNLVSRILPLTSSDIPEAISFRELCKSILGVKFDIFAGDSMQQIGVQVNLRNAVALEAMGTGLSGTLSLLLGLSTAKRKLFIIEEPEDDLHPKALKDLLDAIIAASGENQFLISTHNSTVLTKLGAVAGTTVVYVESDGKLLPTSSYRILTGRSERLSALQDLGYSLADMDLGQGWLIFEESSAERLVRQYLARWFAPKLQELRTIAARGASRVEPLFDNFREMFLYAHLEPLYHNRAWVVVDGDDEGINLVDRLKSEFASWSVDHFRHWNEPAFEYYYPPRFSEEVRAALAIPDRRKKKDAKAKLLLDVISWIEEDEDRARAQFEQSAAGVIDVLRSIQLQMTSA